MSAHELTDRHIIIDKFLLRCWPLVLPVKVSKFVFCCLTKMKFTTGKHKCETSVCIMETKKDDSPLKTRFLTVRKEIYNHYTEKQQTEQ